LTLKNNSNNKLQWDGFRVDSVFNINGTVPSVNSLSHTLNPYTKDEYIH